MAGGGEVMPFCSEAKMHNKDCEYYMAGGGGVPNQNDIQVDAPNPADIVTEQSAPNPNDIVVEPGDKYESTTEKLKTAAEGAAQGFAGPLATLAETKLMGVKPEDIRGRAEANPWIHGGSKAAGLVGGLLTGTGEAGLIVKGAGEISEAAELGAVGSTIIKGMVEGASFAGSDEITKAMLHQPGSDPEMPASAALLNVGAAGLMGGLGGSIFGLGEKMIGKGLSGLEGQKASEGIQKLLSKLGEDGKPLDTLGLTSAIKTQVDIAAYPLAGKISSVTGIPPGVAWGAINRAVEKPLSKIFGRLNNYSTDAIIHCLLTNKTSGIPNAIHYANNILRGSRLANKAVGSLFSAGAAAIAPDVSEKEKEHLKEFISGGQVDKQVQNSLEQNGMPAFAGGGMVSSPNDHFSSAFPLQNNILNTAKGRVSNYLNSIRPLPNEPKLPFDKKDQQAQKNKEYESALNFAVNPLKILDHVNSGDLTPGHMKHFTQMYPEVHRYLSKEITNKIVETQMKDGDAPPYKKRQAMSLFLGTSLDSTFLPQSISAIQGMYAMKSQAQQPQGQKPKKSTSPLSKIAPSAMTDAQARTQREQNQKA